MKTVMTRISLALVILTGSLFILGCTPRQLTTTATITETFTQTQTLTPETVTRITTSTITQHSTTEVTFPPVTETLTVTQTATPVPTTVSPVTADVTVSQAFNMIQDNASNPKFVILDVRTPEERSGWYLEGSALIDIRSESWIDTVNALDRSHTYLVYCLAGGRSSSAMGIMASLGFYEVYNMLGGIDEWEAAGYPVVKPLPPPTTTTQTATTTPPTTTAGSG